MGIDTNISDKESEEVKEVSSVVASPSQPVTPPVVTQPVVTQSDEPLQSDVVDQRNASTIESVTSKVMVADENNIIVSVNPAALTMMRLAESDIRQALPQFSADKLVGSSIDVFHQNPAHQQGMLASLSSTFDGQIAVGPRTFDLIASPIFSDAHVRLGTVVEWSDVTEKLKTAEAEKEAEIAAAIIAGDNARIKSALDCVTSNVMMADADNNIVYANEAVVAMLAAAESDIKTDLPNFSSANVIGSNVDIFHKNPAHQQSMLKSLESTYRTEIEVGGRTFGLIANPVSDNEGTRLATVVEWEDKTEQLLREQEEHKRVEKEKIIASDNARIKSALDSVTSNVMMADADNNIVYANEAVIKMLLNAESDIRKDLPSFNANTVIGSNVDIFHRNPAHQQKMLESLADTYRTDIVVGGRTFALIANPVFDADGTRLATVVEWEDKTDQLIREQEETDRIEREKIVSAENSRIRSALDSVSSNVMMADAANNIVYANAAVITMLRNAEADIRKELPSFTTDTVIGSNIDIFHKNPAHQRNMLSALAGTYRTDIVVGGRTFSLVANPVFDTDGTRLATVVEWADKTEELAFENVVDNTIEAAVKGELSERIDLNGKEGFIAKVGSGLNELMDVFERIMEDVGSVMGELAQGKLTNKIETDYEGSFGSLKEDINETIDQLVNIVGEITTSAYSVKEGSGEISSGNSNLSQRTEEQAASLEETSAAMEEITTTVQQNAANAVQANTLARGARETAENGGEVVGDAVKAMQAISESSNKINDIIGVIDEIAFQTNLLALNAAVEAARAGDQGRGFAVVADEVRSLAGRSATAAKEIKALIKDSGERVQEGSDLVNKSGSTLEEIVNAVKKVNDIVAEISTASDEQASGLDEINKAIGEMDEMTQQNAALVEEAAAASESLGHQADTLDELVSFFDLGNQSSHVEPAVEQRSSRAPAASRSRARPVAKAKPARKSAKAPEAGDDDSSWSEF